MFEITTYYIINGFSRQVSQVVCEGQDAGRFLPNADVSDIEIGVDLIRIIEPESVQAGYEFRRMTTMGRV